MKVIFSHGKESGPSGSKILRLSATAKRLGFDVQSIDYRSTLDPDQRAQMLIDTLATEATDQMILAGSSMGGYVSLCAASQCNIAGLFLLAPAIAIPGYQQQSFEIGSTPTCIVHGWNDEVIPVQHSIDFARDKRTSLHVLNSDHRLNSVLDEVDAIFAQFLAALP